MRARVPSREKGRRADDMRSVPQPVDLTQVPAVPWAWVDKHVYAAIRGCRVKVLQNERRLKIGCPFRRINGTTIQYKDWGDHGFPRIATLRRWLRHAQQSNADRRACRSETKRELLTERKT